MVIWILAEGFGLGFAFFFFAELLDSFLFDLGSLEYLLVADVLG